MGSSIEKLFKGYVRNDIIMTLSADNEVKEVSPNAGKAWLILGGYYYHITTIDTVIWLTNNPENDNPSEQYPILFKEQVLAAIGNGAYVLFNNTVTGTNGGWRPVFVFSNTAIKLTGAQLATLQLQVLEFDV